MLQGLYSKPFRALPTLSEVIVSSKATSLGAEFQRKAAVEWLSVESHPHVIVITIGHKSSCYGDGQR